MVILLMLSVLPSNGSSQTLAEKPVIRFADVGWDSVRFHNALAALVAERIFNYETKEYSSTSVVAHEAIIKGELDVQMEEWTDNLATYQEDVKKKKLRELGINFDDNTQGFYVPRYVIEGDSKRGIAPMAPELRTVKDLAKYPNLFPDKEAPGRGAIYGGIPGWGVTEIMRKKVANYGLGKWYNYVEPGTDSALNAVISSAYDKGLAVVRMTALGIRQVDREVVEASRAFGATFWQTLSRVQIPQALPTIMAGVNQTLMMAMSMVVTCSMIGARGLGHEVLVAVQRMEMGRGLRAGICIVIMAVLLDRLTQGYMKKDREE